VQKGRNVLGIVALVTAIVGAIFACIPGALIVGWVLLPLALVLGIVALCLPAKRKGAALAAVIVSVIGTVVGVVVFTMVVSDAVDDAFGGTARVDSSSGSSGSTDSANSLFSGQNASDEKGSRDNPAAIGETLSNDDWDMVVNSFTPNVDADVASANPYNEPAAEGFKYAMVNLTVTYKGEGSQDALMLPVALVADDGRVFQWHDHNAVVFPEPRLEGEMYAGGTVSGNLVYQVPNDWAGVVRVGLGMFGDEVFVATQ